MTKLRRKVELALLLHRSARWLEEVNADYPGVSSVTVRAAGFMRQFSSSKEIRDLARKVVRS